MIRLTRQRTTQTVPPSLRGEKRRQKERELLRHWRDHLVSGSDKSPKWKTSYWKAGKPRLKKDTSGKCAYCESPTDIVAHGDVEHFRPKSRYWWLVYCFDNHLFSCQICNQTYKGDIFPLGSGGVALAGPKVTKTTTDAELDQMVDTFAPDGLDVANGYMLADFGTACQKEKAGLPDPYSEDPEPYFKWEVDETNKEVHVKPRTNSARHRFIHKSCVETFGLNREELRRWRWRLGYAPLIRLKDILDGLNHHGIMGAPRQTVIEGIQEMMEPEAPYAAMARFFVKVEWSLNLGL